MANIAVILSFADFGLQPERTHIIAYTISDCLRGLYGIVRRQDDKWNESTCGREYASGAIYMFKVCLLCVINAICI